MRTVLVNDKRQKGYTYTCVCPIGEDFDESFRPHLTPAQMLEAGVFGGCYLNDCQEEFPVERFKNAKLSSSPDPKVNFFGVKASLPLHIRQEKGRIYEEDPRGWFQWYCRYYMGRRISKEDERQIKRRRAYKRHRSAVQKNCIPMDRECRKKQRQSLLHWAYDGRKL